MPPHASVSLTVCTRNGTLTRGYTLRSQWLSLSGSMVHCTHTLSHAQWYTVALINTKKIGQTDEALEDLQMYLHEHAVQITEKKRLRPGGALAECKRASSPAASSSDEGTDTGPPARRQRTDRPRSDDDASIASPEGRPRDLP